MMSRRIAFSTAVAALLALAAAPAVHAESSAYFGLDFPTGDFSDAAGTGWTMGAFATKDVLPTVDVGGLVAYHDFATERDNYEVGSVFGASVNAWEFQALGQVEILMLKGFVGAGVANYSGVDDSGNSKRRTDFAWQFGAAMKALLFEWRLTYHQFSAEQVSANWIGISGGIVF